MKPFSKPDKIRREEKLVKPVFCIVDTGSCLSYCLLLLFIDIYDQLSWKGRARHGYWPYKESLLEYFTQLQGCENPRGVEQSQSLHWNLPKFTSHLSSMLLENMACIIRLDICHKIYRDVDFEVKVLHGIHRFSLLFKKEVRILSHPTGWAKIPTFLIASHSIKAKWPKSRGKWESRRAILCMTKNNYPHDLDI